MSQILRWGGVLLGVLGILLCAAALIAVWYYYPPTVQKTEQIYAKLDEALELADLRLDRIQDRVQVVNELTAEYQRDLRSWVEEKQEDPSQLGRRAELLLTRIQTVEEGLEFAETLLQRVRSAKKLAHPFREENETVRLDKLLEEIASLRTLVSGLVSKVEAVREGTADSDDEGILEQKIEAALSELVQILNLIESADERLDQFHGRLTEAREQAGEIEQEILSGLWWGRFAASLLFPWMALGQWALCRISLARRATEG